MSFQSIISPSREGWKSQRLFAQICHSCLSRRTPVLTHHIRRNTSLASAATSSTSTATSVNTTIPLKTAIKPYKPTQSKPSSTSVTTRDKQKLLESLRNELYHHDTSTSLQSLDPRISSYSPLVRKAISRRESRKQLLEMYYSLKASPHHFAQLTQMDIDTLVSRLMSNPDDLTTNASMYEAYQILQDLKRRKFKHAQYRLGDAEKMIYLATELNHSKRAEDLLAETTAKWKKVGMETYEAVMRVLSKNKQQDRIDYWLEHIQRLDLAPTRSIVSSVIMCMVASDQLEAAAHYLKRNHPGQDLAQLVTRYVTDDRQLLDEALNVFAMDCMRQWRLNDMRLIYMRKRHFGMSTFSVVKNLLDKSIHTGQLHTAEQLLSDTLYMQDTTSAQVCSRKLIEWYTSQKDIAHAVSIWEQMEEHNLAVPLHTMQVLLARAAKLRYHVDTMRLYKRCKELYPGFIQADTTVHVLRCLIRSKQFDTAQVLSLEVEKTVPEMKPNLAKAAVRALFSLSAQTGQVDLFESAFQLNKQLDLSLTHVGLSSLVACYLIKGDVQSAKSTFKIIAAHTTGPDVVDFNLLMRATVMEEDKTTAYDKILDILTHMKLVNVTPDLSTMRTMLNSYDAPSAMRDSLYDKLLNSPSASRADQVFLNNIAITNLLKKKKIEFMVGLLFRNNRGELFPGQDDKHIEVNGLTFKILMDAATFDDKNSSIAEKLFKSMRSRGMKPEKETYEKLIAMLARKGRLQKARKYIIKMEQETGCKANVETYTKLVDGLLKIGKPHLAKEIILQDMPLNNIPLNNIMLRKLRRIERKLSPT
ncbi:acetylornithine aminotransferase [Mucor velutinosus]|uniref:Acetylornithine aminotransferase n=1 Tax=Mucor velutinosus TaxID=708070 RepID=A0AAN7D3P2_9FUNG|nr:acetylornithine aminotransferase [Mucor velutinosus]